MIGQIIYGDATGNREGTYDTETGEITVQEELALGKEDV